MLFENEQKKYVKLIKAINKGESKENLIELIDDLVNAFMSFYDGMIFPIDEYSNENYLVHREAFVTYYDMSVHYGYTLYEWTGGYREELKEWREIFHCTSEKKQKVNQEWVDKTLRLLEILRNKKKENKDE